MSARIGTGLQCGECHDPNQAHNRNGCVKKGCNCKLPRIAAKSLLTRGYDGKAAMVTYRDNRNFIGVPPAIWAAILERSK